MFFDYCSRTAKRKTNRGFECMYREILVLPCVELGLYGIKFIRFICFPFFLLLLLSSFFFYFTKNRNFPGNNIHWISGFEKLEN